MATSDGYANGESSRSKRCRVAGDRTDGNGGESGRVAGGSTGNDGGSGGYIDRDSDANGGGHAEEADGDGDCSGEEDYIYDGSDSDGEGYGEATEVNATSDPAVAEKRYKLLTEDDVRARQEADTAKVAEVLSIPPGFAAVLLRHFKWAPGRLQDEWFSDDRRVRDAVGLPPDGVPVPAAANPRPFDCAICFGRFPAGRMRSAGCAHFYCGECWRGYVRAAVDDGPRCLALRCPDPSCPAAVVRELVDEVAGDADRALYARFALRSYVEENGGGRIKWCPGPGCDRVVEFRGEASGAADVFCACRHGFCFRCGEDPHRPVSCATVRAWLEKNSSDSETTNWVLVNTKHCPRCRRPIEKNHGCMHMTCSAPCGYQFCWLCLDPWDNHTGCAAYRSTQGGPDDGEDLAVVWDEQRRWQAKASLDRYLYHYERWAANHASLRMALADMEQLERSGLESMATAVGLPDIDLGFMAEAYKQIIDGRRVLQWTSAYGYYLDPERDGRKKRELFDYLQDQANSWLERLHGCVELERREIFCAGGDAAVVAELMSYYKKKVTDLTAATQTFLGNLVKAFETDDLPEFKALN